VNKSIRVGILCLVGSMIAIYTVRLRLRLDGTFCSVVCSSSGEKRRQMSNVKGVFGLKLEC